MRFNFEVLAGLLLGLCVFSLPFYATAQDENPALLDQQVRNLYQEGKVKEAIPIAAKLLAIREKSLGPDNPDTAKSLNNLAFLYDQTGDYAKAEPLYQQALRIYEKLLGPEHQETAQILDNLAGVYCSMAAYAKAEPLYQQALKIRETVLGPEHPGTAANLNNLAALYYQIGAYAKAEPLFERALQIREKVLGPEHPDTATTLNNLGELYQAIGEYPKAEPILREALRIRQKVHGPEHPTTAGSLNNLALLYDAKGEYAKAEPLYQQALRIFNKVLGPEHPLTVTTLNNLAGLYQITGDFAKAEAYYQEVLKTRQKVLGPEHPDTAVTLDNLAELYQAMGDYSKAGPLFQQANQIFRKVLGPEHPNTATTLSDLAVFYEDIGDYAQAEPLFQQALQIREKVFGPAHRQTAVALGNLGLLYARMGDYAKAEPLCEQALKITQKVLGPEHPDNLTSLNNLAELWEHTGDYTKAEPLLEQILQITQKTFGPEHPDTALSLSNLALLFYEKGEYGKAEPLLERVLAIRLKVLGPEDLHTAASFENLAFTNFELGRTEKTKSFALLSAKAHLASLSNVLSFASEQERLAYLDKIQPYALFAILEGTEADMAATVLRYKGVVLDSIVEDRLLAEANQAGELKNLVTQLNLDKKELGQLLLQPKVTNQAGGRIDELQADAERIEGLLAQHVAGLGQARHALAVTLEQVQAEIPDDAALVEYLRYRHYIGKNQWEPRYGAVVLLSKGDPFWIPIGRANEIDHLVRRYGTLVRGSPQKNELAANLQALCKTLWAPIGQMLPDQTKRLIISPDGELNFVSFATLLTTDKQFLAQRYDLQYAASGRDLLRAPKPSTAKEVVLFANPDFKMTQTVMLAETDNSTADKGSVRGSEKRDVEDWSFEDLAGTQKESNQLINKFNHWGWKAIGFTRKAATKTALLNIHSPYILHLATHGFFAKGDPTQDRPDPGAVLNDQQSVTKSKFFKNPMHRSGLALAGAETTIEAWKNDEVPRVENDGILTAEDVSALDLRGTWLVTLSACDTGSGEARAGEGVMGLRRGFIQAGAQNLLMTLWPISDEVTVQIMSDFYDAAHESGNAPGALAKVQRDWLVKLRAEKGLSEAVSLAGPFIMSSQGKP